MKNHYIISIYAQFIIVAVILLMSCSERDDGQQPVGHLRLIPGISVEVHDIYSNLKAASTDDFSIEIFNEWDLLVKCYDNTSEMPEIIDLKEGSYYAVTRSDNNQPAAFENPYYSGRSEIFNINAGETTTVTITASLANIMVTVIYAQSVIEGFNSYTTNIRNSGGNLIFDQEETRAGYFDQGPLEINALLTYDNGSGIEDTLILNGQITEPEAGKHYEIHVEAIQTEGTGAFAIILDYTFETEIVSIQPPMRYGDLLITEIMFDPYSLNDSEGEWFEIYNNSPYSQNLRDLVIRRGSNNSFHIISSDIIMNSGCYAVFGRTNNATDNVDYTYESISLNNTNENLIINKYGSNGTDGEIICNVHYGTDGFPTGSTGKSIQLNRGISLADAALLGSNWCLSTLAYSTGDLGTPGTENSICE